MQNTMLSHGALGWCPGRCAMPVRTFISAEFGRLRKAALVQSKVQGTASTLSGMHRTLGHERPDRHMRGIHCRARATSVPAAMIQGEGTHSPMTPTTLVCFAFSRRRRHRSDRRRRVAHAASPFQHPLIPPSSLLPDHGNTRSSGPRSSSERMASSLLRSGPAGEVGTRVRVCQLGAVERRRKSPVDSPAADTLPATS